MIVYWLCNISVAAMKLVKDPPGGQLMLLMTLFLQLIINSNQTHMIKVSLLTNDPIQNLNLKSGETYEHKDNNRPQRWVQQADYQSIQPHYQEQYIQTQYMGKPLQTDILQPQNHPSDVPIRMYHDQDLTYKNQYADYTGYSSNINTQKEVKSKQFIDYSTPNHKIYEGNVPERGHLFQYQTEGQQQYQPYYNEEQNRDSLLLFTGYDDYDLANSEWEIVNEKSLNTQDDNTLGQMQIQNIKTTTDGYTNDLHQFKRDNNIEHSYSTLDNDNSDINLETVRNPKMLWEEPTKQNISYETKLDKIQLLQQQLLQKQNYLMELYENLKQDRIIDHPNLKPSLPEYSSENKVKEIIEPEIYYDQIPVMANQLKFTDNIIENSIEYDYSHDGNLDVKSNYDFRNYDQYNKNDIPYNEHQYESGVIYEYENYDNQVQISNLIYPYNRRQYIEPKYTYKYPEKHENDLDLPYKFPEKNVNDMNLPYKFPKNNHGPKWAKRIKNGDLYTHKKGRSMNLGDFEDENSKSNMEENTINNIGIAHSLHDENILLDGFSSAKRIHEPEEQDIMEARIEKTIGDVRTMDDIPKTDMINKIPKVKMTENFEKCDPWDPNTKTESVTSSTNFGDGTLKTTISKKYCDNNTLDNKSGQETPCFKMVTTETTVINEYCLLPEYQEKNKRLEPCFKNTTTSLSVTTEPCDKIEDNILEIEKNTTNNESSSIIIPPIPAVTPTKNLNSSLTDNELYDMNVDNRSIEKFTAKNESSSVNIHPKVESITMINISSSLANNKIHNTKTDNISDCMDYREYIKDFTNSNGCIIKSSGVSEEDINIILELHNLLRSKVARGEEKLGGPGPQPPAANMKELRWNNDLARAAQAWAQQCPQEKAPPKYKKICSRNYEIGQNVAYFGVKIDDKPQQKGKYNDEAINRRRKKRFVDQSDSFEDTFIEEDISDNIIDDDDDMYLEESLIDEDMHLEESIIDDNDDMHLEESIIANDDDMYLEESLIDGDMHLEESIIDDNDDMYLEESVIDDGLQLEDSVIDDDIQLEESVIDDDMKLEDSLIDDKMHLEEYVIDDDTYLEDSVIGGDTYSEDFVIDDGMYLEDEIIEDDRSEENTIINDNSNEDETFTRDDLSDEEALVELDSFEDQSNGLNNAIENSEEFIMDNIEFLPKLNSYEKGHRNQNKFNSLDKAQNKVKGWKNIIMGWYNGVDLFPNYMVNSITNLKNIKKGIDEYLQIVWAKTEEIGCTVIHFSDKDEDKEERGDNNYYYKEEELSSVYVCNYGPAASRDKTSMYMVGDAGSECLDGVSADYHDLCRSNNSFT